MIIWDTLIRSLPARFLPYVNRSWNHRIVQVICAATCLSALYYLFLRIGSIFKAKPTIQPLPPSSDLSVSVIVPSPGPHPAEIPPIDQTMSHFHHALPDEILLNIFNHAASLATLQALTKTCQRFKLTIPKAITCFHRIISIEINPLITPCTENNSVTAGNQIVIGKVLDTLWLFPHCVIFPELDGPLIPVIRQVFRDLNAIKINFGPSSEFFIRQRLNLLYRHQLLPLNKFAYNIPGEIIDYKNPREVEEMNRRFALKELGEQDLDHLNAVVTHHPEKQRFSIFATPGVKIFLETVSCEFLTFILEKFGHSDCISEALAEAFFKIEDRQDIYKKLCIFWEHFHKTDTKEQFAYSLSNLLFPTMHLLSWKSASQPLPSYIDFTNVLSWIPYHYLEFELKDSKCLGRFKKDLAESSYRQSLTDLNPVLGSYNFQDLFDFLLFLREKIPNPSSVTALSCKSLRETLKTHGVLLYLSIDWVEHLFELDRCDVYEKLLALGEHYLQYHHRQRTTTSDLEILLFPAMHLLEWKPLNPPPGKNSDSSEKPLPDELKILLKKAVFSWLPKHLTAYFESLKSTYRLRWGGANDHYSFLDASCFICALQLESQSPKGFRPHPFGQPVENS